MSQITDKEIHRLLLNETENKEKIKTIILFTCKTNHHIMIIMSIKLMNISA